MFLVDVTLYTGQHLQCEPTHCVEAAYDMAFEYCARTMVEDAIVINTRTGEVVHRARNLAAMWRTQ